ncbi:MAG: GNAT family N-acetyltransferase [Actinomycetota bacterium]|nr:GNAT family N-acetyltransferase [Actinomycetota bacterium]
MPNIIERKFGEIDALTLYQLLRLRVDIFVVEQGCAYPELDGRDIDPDTRHIWIDGSGGPLAYLRVLAEPVGGHRIGRVATVLAERNRGLAGTLIDHVVKTTTGQLVLDAQAYLEAWYLERGFHTVGEPFLEEGILHVPMTCRSHAVQPG